jgi:6-phosphogluconate dehydrogenase
MDIGIIGLGRMGAGMARRWLRHGHRVVVNNRSHDPIKELEKDGAVAAYDLPALVAALPAPRAIWIMLPAGATTEQMIENLVPLLSPGDTLIDSGNTNFNDDIRRAPLLAAKGINYIDQGTSGGIWGLEKGFCLMVGGEPAIVKQRTTDPVAPGRDDEIAAQAVSPAPRSSCATTCRSSPTTLA